MPNFYSFCRLVALVILAGAGARAQGLPGATLKKIDALFQPWSSTTGPGCVVGIVRHDSLLYARGFGMANLEYNEINTPQTLFHVASVSKQFTAYAIVLLARQHKLSLDDDIRKYLPQFPDLKTRITIRHLLTHTSGLRDQWQLLDIAGTQSIDVITQQHVLRVLNKQRALNFAPGSRFLYCNSGFTLLAEIIRNVSGKDLRAFTDSAIFQPLGMRASHFHDDYNELDKWRAYSYQGQDNHLGKAILNYSTVGATSLFSNVQEMSKWLMNFYDPKAGDLRDIAVLTHPAQLNNGTRLPYALGIAVTRYRGQLYYSHDGSDAGFRTNVGVFPRLKLGFVVFGNVGSVRAAQLVHAMADLFVKDSAASPRGAAPAPPDSSRAILADTTGFRNIVGSYRSETGNECSFHLQDKKLYWVGNAKKELLLEKQKNVFVVLAEPRITFQFTANPALGSIARQYSTDTLSVWYRSQPALHLPDKELLAYTGTYYCPELECVYRIVLKNRQLLLASNKYPNATLTLAGRNILLSSSGPMPQLTVLRSRDKKITGFDAYTSRVKHLFFQKVAWN